jgi:hypothetical protein
MSCYYDRFNYHRVSLCNPLKFRMCAYLVDKALLYTLQSLGRDSAVEMSSHNSTCMREQGP